MPRFILIDNSIIDTSGHHYQYAAHCLIAAKELGYTPVLATNKKFSSSDEDRWQTEPMYTHDFWSISKNKRASLLLRLNRNFSKAVNVLKYKSVFSWIGYSWENRHQLLSLNRLPADDEMKSPASWLILAAITVPIFLGVLKIRDKVAVTKMSLFRWMTSGEKIDPVTGMVFEKQRSQKFADETKKLFKKIKIEDGDIVFIPTVGMTEMLGLLDFFNDNSESKLASWHLLFRRNIYTGRESEYWRQDEKLRPLRNSLFHFVQSITAQKVYFYTDTDELTAQYNRLAVTKFRTLPLPHTNAPEQKKRDKSFLTVTYIGDARTEKGYQHLPRIVNDLCSDYVQNDKVHFVFQSNYNIPQGEPKIVVARSELENFPNDKVKLIYEPLSFNDYTNLFLSSDIVILPYDQTNYYARSSGILVECLAAGIPVIVPSATWLSRQFLSEVSKYHLSLIDKLKTIESFENDKIEWKRHEKLGVNPFVDGELIFGGETTKAYTFLEKPFAASHLLISFTMNTAIRSCMRVDVVQLRYDGTKNKYDSPTVERLENQERSTVLIPLGMECYHIWLGFKNAFGNEAMRISNISITFLAPPQSDQNIPISAVGLIYNDPNEISNLLRDAIDNYDHYNQTTLRFAQDYFRIHNAKRLVEELARTTNDDSIVAISAAGNSEN